MTGHIYRDVIREQHVLLFWGAMGAEFLLMDGNTRPHHANIVDECLQSENITRMDLPAYSTDLNTIEHVWDMLSRRIAARQPPRTCLPELRRALLDKWCNIPQNQIDNLILSMPRCSSGQNNCDRPLTVNYPSPLTERHFMSHIPPTPVKCVPTRQCKIELFPWPALSLDLSPIENMWSMVAQRLTQSTSPAFTPDQLWQRVEAAWSSVPQEHIQSLFESMPRRVTLVISNIGGYSGY
ncbi:transposable element Tcb1 transposase [Trichonephila clavipes]|nr:transposable element Tcb1 transposase [Trichonephila clavipes]